MLGGGRARARYPVRFGLGNGQTAYASGTLSR